jgi:Mlc titration factor MtfA (ptsG expression regulator)
LYQVLQGFYRQDPAERFARAEGMKQTES